MEDIKKIKKLLRLGVANVMVILPKKYNNLIENLDGEVFMKKRVGGGENFLIEHHIMKTVSNDKFGVIDGYGFHNKPIQVKCNSKKKNSFSFPLKNIYPLTDVPIVKELYDMLYRQRSSNKCREIEKLSTNCTLKMLRELNTLAIRFLSTNSFKNDVIGYIDKQYKDAYSGVDIMCFQFDEKIGKYKLYINPTLIYNNTTRGDFKFDIDMCKIKSNSNIDNVDRVEHNRPTISLF
jgi:hypothetical protein